MSEWIVNPLTIYGLLAASMVSCLYLVISVTRAVSRTTEAAERSRQSLTEQIERLTRQVKELGGREVEPEPDVVALAAALAAQAPPVLATFKSEPVGTPRNQALKMHQRGEAASTIASTLDMPRAEVELLLKVQQIASARA